MFMILHDCIRWASLECWLAGPGRGELADRQQHLAQMLSKLQKISEVPTAKYLTREHASRCVDEQDLFSSFTGINIGK
jgi:hypothetical protein